MSAACSSSEKFGLGQGRNYLMFTSLECTNLKLVRIWPDTNVSHVHINPMNAKSCSAGVSHHQTLCPVHLK